MDQNQNRDNDLFNFDNQPPQPTPPDEPTVFAGSARVYEPAENQQAVPPPPPYTPPPYNPPPPVGQPPAKPNRTWLIVVIVLVLLCCCCLAFAVFMYQVGGDWLLEQMELQQLLPAATAFMA